MDYKAFMKDCLKDDQQRIKHTLNVKNRAIELGKLYGADLEVLKVAALLHDITKNKSKEYHINKINDSQYLKNTPEQLWHAKSAMIVAKEIGITNSKILEAIEYHVYGKINMNTETLILVIADYTEKDRMHESAKEVYNIALNNIDKAYLYMVDKIILHLIKTNKPIAKEQYEVYNYIKRRTKDK